MLTKHSDDNIGWTVSKLPE